MTVERKGKRSIRTQVGDLSSDIVDAIQEVEKEVRIAFIDTDQQLGLLSLRLTEGEDEFAVGFLCERELAGRVRFEDEKSGDLILVLSAAEGGGARNIGTRVNLGNPSRGGVGVSQSTQAIDLIDIRGYRMRRRDRFRARGLFADPVRFKSAGFECDVVLLALEQNKGGGLFLYKVVTTGYEFGAKRELYDNMARLVIEGFSDVGEVVE